jgi:hypothetical protein
VNPDAEVTAVLLADHQWYPVSPGTAWVAGADWHGVPGFRLQSPVRDDKGKPTGEHGVIEGPLSAVLAVRSGEVR